MEHSDNLIFQILEANDLTELFLPHEETEVKIEVSIPCTKNSGDSKKYEIPLSQILEWIQFLKNIEDVLAITQEKTDFSETYGVGKEMRVSLTLKVKGAMKQPKKEKAFEKVFFPLYDMLLKLLSERLSYNTYLEQSVTEASPRSRAVTKEKESEGTSLAQSAIA